MTTRSTRSAPNRPRPPPTRAPPGTRPWPPSAQPTAPMSAACPTAGCCTCATPTPSRPPGPPGTSATSCARSAPPPGTPAWPACAPPPRPAPQSSTATTATPRPSTSWPPATRPWSGPTGSARRCSPRRWPTAPTGRHATRAQRQLAVAADAELRRRHPGQYFSPLRSAEPAPATSAQRDQLTLTPDQPPGEIDQWITDLAAGHRTFADKLADRQSQMHPVPGPRLRRPRPGVPRLGQPEPRADLAAAQARDPAIPADPRAGDGPRHRLGSRRLTVAGYFLKSGT